MIVASIISLLATIVLPKFALALQKSKEGSAKGNLGAIRSAITIYYADHEGQFPPDLTSLTANGKYIKKIPPAIGLAGHADSNTVSLLETADDAGGWIYHSTESDADFGSIRINCTHSDSSGKVWTTY